MPIERVEAAPDRSAQRREASRPTIGMLTTSLVALYQVQWLGAVDGARAHQANLVTFVGRELESPLGFDAQANAVYDLVSREQLDGLILWTTALQLFVGLDRLEELSRRLGPLPIVSVEQVLLGHTSLLMDNQRGMYEAVSHLIEAHGHRRIAFVRGPEHHLGAQERYQGYLDALAQHGLPFDPALVAPPSRSWHPTEAADWLSRLLDQQVDLEAVAAVNDALALGVLAALDVRNVRAPEDVAVVGFDDVIGIYSAIDPVNRELGLGREDRGTYVGDALARAVNLGATTLPLTTVRAPFHELGRRAVELVLAQIRGEPVPEVDSIRTELVVRRSCGCFSPAVQQLEPEPQVRVPRSPAAGSRAQMLQALSVPAGVLPADWADRLLSAYLAELEGAPGDLFLRVLDELLRVSMRSGERLESWWRILRALRRSSADLLTGEAVAREERLWARVQRLMDETAERFSAYQRLVAEKRNQLVREVGQRLISALDVGQLGDALAGELANVRIPSCYLASYASAAPAEDGDAEQRRWARAILVYEDGQRVDIPDEEALFRSKELVPGGRLEREQPYSLVAVPLYFNEQQLGFVLFEVGPRTGWIYEALQEQLSSALEGALLVERERSALASVEEKNRLLQREIQQREQVEAALQRARDELEERVAVRTAELAKANEGLTEQIIERERAEAVQVGLEEQLRQAQKMEAIGRLAGGIAHDFNNMLVVINGLSELLLRGIDADDQARHDLEQIRYAGERAADLTRRLLAFGRQQVLQPRVLNLNDVLTNVEAMLQHLIGEDVALATILEPSLARVRVDAGQIEQLILNLALNARDAMPDGGRLRIETANVDLDQDYVREHIGVEAGPHVLLRVSDTGIGMDADTEARLFEPFFTTKPAGRGTGLGLATVFGIVQQSGGHIAVSTAPGQGTTFEIYLPQSTLTAQEAAEPAIAPSSLGGSETILLVEDEPGVRGASRRFLEEHGYRVLEAADGGEALHLCEWHDGPVDLMITDVVMPGMSGRELVEHMARIRPETPVLYVSGYIDSTLRRKELAEATVPLLQKPFSADALARKVRETLDARPATSRGPGASRAGHREG
jgi:signal transduction histidine kinase/DNA-binding LacI/PurR family transcriptional regulator/ActR/RegA family two-component response regulator